VVAHGNGPQVGLLALQAESYEDVEPYPLDILGAETEGMIGYMVEQELANALTTDVPLATLLTMIEVDPADPAFEDPTKFVGPVYEKPEADRLADEKDWTFKLDGDRWRRVVASPLPKRIVEIQPISWLLEHGAIVIYAGGGGIPTMFTRDGRPTLVGVEAVIDKDFASELLAEDVGAQLFVMATDVDAVYADWGTPQQQAIRSATPEELGASQFAAGSMGPKVSAACWFAQHTGRFAAIGSIADTQALLRGEAGTRVAVETAVTAG